VLEPGDTLIPFSDGLLDLYDGTLAALDEIVEVVRAPTTSAGTVATFAERARTVPLLADDVAVVVTRRAPR
jgi:hypothetical protein